MIKGASLPVGYPQIQVTAMAKNNSGGSVGGFVFNIFNIGFTVVMFLLPTAGLVYWYLYIRDPGGGPQPPQVIVQEAPGRSERDEPIQPPVDTAKPPERAMTSGFFNEPARAGTDAAGQDDSEKPEPKTPARGQYETRTWKDESGKFSIQASFYSVTGATVKLVTGDDNRIEAPIAKLSEQDKEYLRAIFRDKGIQPRF
jgi:hypothetical protein